MRRFCMAPCGFLPCFDYWEVPWPIEEEDEKVPLQAIARFDNGRPIDWSETIAAEAIE